MPLPPLHLFRTIKATFFTMTHRFDTLTIDNGDTWFRISFELNSYLFAEAVIDLL